jgi:hypothetical protein
MFDFFGDRIFLVAFTLLMALAIGIGLSWTPVLPRVMRYARLGFGLPFVVGAILVGMKWGDMAGGVCFLAGLFFCFLVGLPLGYFLWMPPTADGNKPADPGAARDPVGR